MGLEKAIEHKKEKRKPYRGSKRVSKSCRNHGGCDWCKENRTHNSKIKEIMSLDELESYEPQSEYEALEQDRLWN